MSQFSTIHISRDFWCIICQKIAQFAGKKRGHNSRSPVFSFEAGTIMK